MDVKVDLSLVLVGLGVVGLAVFGWLVWPPLALLVVSVASLTAGLIVDLEALSGKPARTPPRQ